MARPRGITLIAIVNLLCAAWGAFDDIRLIAKSGFTSLRSEDYQDTALMASMVLILTSFPVLYAMSAWGLWRMRNWGRVLAIVLVACGSAMELLRWLVTRNFRIRDSVATTVSLTIYGAIALYLLKPEIKAMFSLGTTRTAQETP